MDSVKQLNKGKENRKKELPKDYRKSSIKCRGDFSKLDFLVRRLFKNKGCQTKIGERLICLKDNRSEVLECDTHAIGVFKKLKNQTKNESLLDTSPSNAHPYWTTFSKLTVQTNSLQL